MSIQKNMREVIDSLSPKEKEVLRRRFGIDDEIPDDSDVPRNMPPTDTGNSGGTGGVPAPLLPPDTLKKTNH
jgi:hypothetical protein